MIHALIVTQAECEASLGRQGRSGRDGLRRPSAMTSHPLRLPLHLEQFYTDHYFRKEMEFPRLTKSGSSSRRNTRCVFCGSYHLCWDGQIYFLRTDRLEQNGPVARQLSDSHCLRHRPKSDFRSKTSTTCLCASEIAAPDGWTSRNLETNFHATYPLSGAPLQHLRRYVRRLSSTDSGAKT